MKIGDSLLSFRPENGCRIHLEGSFGRDVGGQRNQQEHAAGAGRLVGG